MTILLDTNILVRFVQRSQPQHALAANALTILLARNEALCVVPQVLYEFWSVATRPAENNGLGFTPAEAGDSLDRIREVFVLLPEPDQLIEGWERLVRTLQIRGKSSHEARLAATMQCHHVDSILTFNRDHFTRFPGLRVMTPAEVLSAS